jgi:hypothetical protein
MLISVIVAVVFFVIAAVFIALYALTPSPPNPGNGYTPAGVITQVSAMDAKNEKLTFGQFNPDTKWSDLRMLVDDETTTWGFTITHISGGTLNFTLTLGTNPTLFPSGSDLAGDNKVSNGDFINIHSPNGFNTGKIYKVQIIYIPTNNKICEKTFTR